MEQPKNKFLQICGILMIIGGIVGILISAIAVVGILLASVVATAVQVTGVGSGLVTVALLISIIGSIVTLIAGIMGVKNAAKPENAGKCITIGFVNIAFTVLSNVIGLIGGSALNTVSLFTGLILPGLYLFGAYQSKGKSV